MSQNKLRPILVPLLGGLLSVGAFGALIGSADMHGIQSDGGLTTQSTSQSDCQFRPPIDAPPLVDAGPDGPPESDFGATMDNQSGNDDDCKYHVTWTATPIYENFNVSFNVVATVINTTTPVTGANIYAEVYLSDTHEAPPTAQTAVENPPGTYKVGPIQFDAPGQWTVRFHLFENCLDYADDSPHGHAAFFVNVP
jgi:hypothetical protein